MTIYKGSKVAYAECVDEANINVVSKNREDEIISAVDWDSNLCNNLEEMLPEDNNEDQKKKTLALLELYASVATGSGQSGYPGQMGHFFTGSCGSPGQAQIIRVHNTP